MMESRLPNQSQPPTTVRSRELLYPGPSSGEAKKTLRTTVDMVRRGWWLVALFVVLSIGIAAVYTFVQPPPKYSAHTLLLLESQQSPSQYEALNFGYIDGPNLGERNVANQLVILQHSLDIAKQTAQRLLSMKHVPDTDQPLTVIGPADAPLSTGQIAANLHNHYVEVTPVEEETDAIWITASSTIPSEAVLIANVYAEEYVKRTQQSSRQRITGSLNFLEEQVTERQEDVHRLEEQIKQARMAGAIALDAETQRAISQIAQLEAGLDEARIDQSIKEASLRSIEQELEQLHPKLVQHMASGVERQIESILTTITNKELVRDQIYAQNPELENNPSASPELENLNNQIAQLQEHVRELSEQNAREILASGGIGVEGSAEGYVAQLNRQLVDERIALSGVKAKISALERRLASYNQKLGTIPERTMRLAQLERAHQSSTQVFNRLVERLEEAHIAAESEIGFAQIVRPALSAEGSTETNVPRILVLGALLGLVLGVGAAAARYKLDTRVYTPDDLREHHIEILSAIPEMQPMIRKEFRNKPKTTWSGHEVSTTLASLVTPLSPAAESFRRLYVSLQFSRPDIVVQTVLITSPEESVGKSTTALNLAVTAAASGKRTLIVEADLRRPTLHDKLGILPGSGLEQVLHQSPDQSAERFATDIINLYAITSDKPVYNPTQLLGSKEMRDFLRRIKSEFDFIVFDSPPVLVATDASFLSVQCDATVIVVAAGRTSFEALRQTTEELESVGASISGIVLNRFDPSHTYGYRDTYGYRYSSSYYAAV